ncbi:unnamed protein product, partial [Symbiodinium sp. KB8]
MRSGTVLLALASAEVVCGDLPKIGKKWWVLGPFASGKVEYEAAPRLKEDVGFGFEVGSSIRGACPLCLSSAVVAKDPVERLGGVWQLFGSRGLDENRLHIWPEGFAEWEPVAKERRVLGCWPSTRPEARLRPLKFALCFAEVSAYKLSERESGESRDLQGVLGRPRVLEMVDSNRQNSLKPLSFVFIFEPWSNSKSNGGGGDGWAQIQHPGFVTGLAATLPHDHIPFQQLLQSPPLGSGSDVLHVQYWVVGALKVKTSGRFGVNCRGLHTFHVVLPQDEQVVGPFAGNIYSSTPFTVPIDFEAPGTYHLLSRVRGKVPLRFACRLETLKATLKGSIQAKNLPDVVGGKLLVSPAPIDLRVQNTGASWLDVRAEVAPSPSSVVSAASSSVRLAPGAMVQVPVLVTVNGPAVEKDAAACVRFELRLVGSEDQTEQAALSVPVQLRCRRSTQSALFSFLDVDGSVALAAVLKPRRPSGEAMPILVSLSGVGVEPQAQADAYKMKPPGAEDYIFGYEEMWVLAPQRDGPHNWEDVGLRAALRSIDVLAESQGADAGRLVVHGHSRGGHGAWALATRIPDRVLGVASACGWYSREEYGDANNLWVHDPTLMHMDKLLLGIFHASVAENENSLHASNLKGLPALVRTAARDQAVPPWFGRRMARHLEEEGANVTFQEFDQEHWWWDSQEPNDGGVMHDPGLRKWTLEAARRPRLALSELLAQGDFVLAAGGPEYQGRFGLRILQRRAPAARGFLTLSRASPGKQVVLTTANVLRFAVRMSGGLGQLLQKGDELLLDGGILKLGEAEEVEVCQSSPGTCTESGEGSGGSWRVCGPGDLRPSLSPIRRVFAEPWVLVIPDTPSALEVLLASYFVAGHLTAVGTATQVLTQTEAGAFRQSHRFVFLGTVARLPWGKSWPLELRSGARNTLHLGGCRFAGQYSAVFRAPAEGSKALGALDLVVTALENQALVDLVSYSFATNQPHTRAPMSNMLPDFMVAGPHFRWKGYGGVVAAGYWDESWQPAPNSAYFRAATQVPAVIVRRILCFATIAQNIRLPACTNLHRLSSMAFTDGEYLMEPLHKLAMKQIRIGVCTVFLAFMNLALLLVAFERCPEVRKKPEHAAIAGPALGALRGELLWVESGSGSGSRFRAVSSPRGGPGVRPWDTSRPSLAAMALAARVSLRARAGLLAPGAVSNRGGARGALPLRAFSGGQGSPWSSLEQFGRETMGKASE